MAVVLTKLYGMDRQLESKLKTKGVKDTEDLIGLAQACDDLPQLAAELEIDEDRLMSLVNRAHLARIRGIGEAYTALLEAAGVKTVSDLASQSPDDLRAEFEQINESQQMVGRVPALAMVNGWVSKAQRSSKA
jgi:predicted flap endonuclease-1-like 5' DNA nuclease